MDGMQERDLVRDVGSFAALGDSFTEGLNDPRPGGGYLGWADRVATVLAERVPGFRDPRAWSPDRLHLSSEGH
jgi:hypothetical protein